MLQQVKKKDKRGISAMIGYILLIGFVIIISVLIYQWMKTYIPTDSLECPEGVSVSISEVECAPGGSNYILNITLKNTGRFNLAGYFIKATDSPEQETATIDLSKNITLGGESYQDKGILYLMGSENTMKPNEIKLSVFHLGIPINSVEITPTRFQEIKGKKRYVICGEARIEEDITC